MRTLTYWLAGSALLATIGCSGGGSNPAAPADLTGNSIPVSPAASASGTLGTPMLQGDLTTSALAIYTLQVDPATLSATASLKETRSGQANDDLYMLSIDSFLKANSFKVTGVTGTANTIDVTYAIAHPFPAPNNPTGAPNGSTNRADLGIAGMALFLTDVPSATGNTYFTDRVANTTTVANADAYYSPGGLITVAGTANTFPYKQLVDELAGGTGSRIGQSNGGDVTGNFGTDGWTRAEFGPTNDGWTGYGVLHQGQTSSNTLSLNKAALSGGFALDVAVVAKYNDPRGGATGAEKKANRLPPAAADASLFAYRMPHGALDASRIIVEAESGGFAPNAISASTLSFHVEDSDARATETSAADLSADAAFDTVAVGESGTPALDVCIPGVLGPATFVVPIATLVDDDSAFGGDAAVDAGLPGDALFFSEVVTKVAGTGQVAGDYIGMVRATDPEVGLLIGLDEALAPLPTAPTPITYQSFTVTMGVANTAPTGAYIVNVTPILQGQYLTIQVTALADAENDDITIQVDWDNNGSFDDVDTQTSPYIVPAFYTSPLAYTTAGTFSLPVRLFDGIDTTNLPTGSFTVNTNPCGSNSSTGTPRVDVWNFAAGVGYGFFSTGGTQQHSDFATTKNTTYGAAGACVTQRLLSAADGNIARRPMPTTTGSALGAITTITSGMTGLEQIHQIEVDSLDRVFYTTLQSTIFTRRSDPATRYASGTTTIRYFDMLAATPVAFGSHLLISVPNPVVAMEIDTNNDLLVIDNQNILRKYTRTTGYTQVVAAPFPLDLKNAPYSITPTGTGAANKKVCDFIYNNHNGALYLLVASQEDIDVADNGYLYRIECDGALISPLGPNRNANPIRLPLMDSLTQGLGGDIAIKNRGATGTLLAGPDADAQIMIGCAASQALPVAFPDYYIINGEFDASNGFFGVQSAVGIGIFPHAFAMGLNGSIIQTAGDSTATTGLTNAYVSWFATPAGTSWPITGWL